MDEKEARSAIIGAISMALKDPTLQKGFECICKENAELKEMYHESDEDNNKLRENIPKLAEAKEIIKTFLAIVNNDVEYVQNPQECKDLWKELCENAETFLKE